MLRRTWILSARTVRLLVHFLLGQPVLAGTFADDEDDFSRTIVYPASWRPVLVNADVLSMLFTVCNLYLVDCFLSSSR